MESFFKFSNSLDLIEVEELLLKRYSNIDYILNLNILEFLDIIKKAYEKETEQALWERWLVDYRHMTEETFISFIDYKERCLGQKIDTTSKEDLIRLAERIEKNSQKKRGEDNGN